MRELEHLEAVAFMQWCELNKGRLPELALLYAIPNGGHRHPAVAAKMKAEGVKAGVPDYCLPVARGGYHGLYLELKAGKNRPTPEQEVWLANLKFQGFYAVAALGWEQASLTLVGYLGGGIVGATGK